MANFRNIGLTQADLDHLFVLFERSAVDFEGNELDLDKLTQALILLYPDNIELFIKLIIARGRFKGGLVRKHFFNAYCISKLVSIADTREGIEALIETIAKETMDLLASTTEAMRDSRGMLPRHHGLETYAQYLAENDKLSDLYVLCDLAENLGWRGKWKTLKGLNSKKIKLNQVRNARNRTQGDSSELIALEWLRAQGYDVALFGKGRIINSKLPHLPIIPDRSVGSSFKISNSSISNTIKNSTKTTSNQQIPLPHELDFDAYELSLLAKACGNWFPCRLRKQRQKCAPCYGNNMMFDPSGEIPIDWTNQLSNADKIEQVRICQNRIGEVIGVMGSNDTLNNQFLKDNLRVHQYLYRYQFYDYWAEGDKGRVKYSYDTYPGRYDFVAFNEKEIVAVEVKSGKSQLSIWQNIRLGLLNRMGHKTMIARVFVRPNGRMEVVPEEPRFCVELPSDQDIQNVLSFVAPNESLGTERDEDTFIHWVPDFEWKTN